MFVDESVEGMPVPLVHGHVADIAVNHLVTVDTVAEDGIVFRVSRSDIGVEHGAGHGVEPVKLFRGIVQIGGFHIAFFGLQHHLFPVDDGLEELDLIVIFDGVCLDFVKHFGRGFGQGI